MSESKTFIMPDNDSGLAAAINNLAQSKGIDPNILLAMNNGGMGNGNGWFVWILFLLILCGNGGWNLGGNNGLSNMINNDYKRVLTVVIHMFFLLLLP